MAVADQSALSFAGLLRQLRIDARLTQEELAEAARLSPRSVSDLERGINRTARKDTALLLADALGLAGPPREVFVAAARGRVPAADVLAALSASRNNLPTPVDSFIGRQMELAEITEAVRAYRMVTLTGPGGSGKTRLALEAAASLMPEFADGVWLVTLVAVNDGQRLIRAVRATARGRYAPGSGTCRTASLRQTPPRHTFPNPDTRCPWHPRSPPRRFSPWRHHTPADLSRRHPATCATPHHWPAGSQNSSWMLSGSRKTITEPIGVSAIGVNFTPTPVVAAPSPRAPPGTTRRRRNGPARYETHRTRLPHARGTGARQQPSPNRDEQGPGNAPRLRRPATLPAYRASPRTISRCDPHREPSTRYDVLLRSPAYSTSTFGPSATRDPARSATAGNSHVSKPTSGAASRASD